MSYCLLGFVFLSAQSWADEEAIAKDDVSIEVDYSTPVWNVEITNQGNHEVRYEMIGSLPRGLGLEVWQGEWGAHLFAGNLAKVAGVDGFPADFRNLAPGASKTFVLDPKSMSSLDPRVITKWQKLVDDGYYNCRVVFEKYASPMFTVMYEDESVSIRPEKSDLSEMMDLGYWKQGVVGVRIRQELKRKGLKLVTYNYGRNGGKESEYEISLTTAAVKDFESNPKWTGDQDLPMPLNELVSRARKIAQQRVDKCELEALGISTCSDNPEKRYGKEIRCQTHSCRYLM